ncbi:MAG: hypothetical protein K0Q95_210 [Bacteroidota bacterium]|jgi:hypothetical protein|nr:hypothetical protein [Bacteroidota bacterium]
MKALFLAMIFPVMCFAQTTKTPTPKPSTTDCPTWNNKQQVNKTDYYQSLRHPKSAKAQAVVAPGLVTEKKPVVKPKAEAKKSTVPSFSSGSDPLLEKKKPVEAKTTGKEETPEETKPIPREEKKPAAVTKEKTEKKPSKKKESAYNAGKVRNAKKSAEKCPAF